MKHAHLRSPSSSSCTVEASPRERGYVLIAFVAILIPLIGIAGAAVASMQARGESTGSELRHTQALMAAEAGFDTAIHELQLGSLTSGMTMERRLPSGSFYSMNATNLRLDGLDNDADGLIDEHGEDVFQVLVRGVHGWGVSRIAGYIARDSAIVGANSALSVQSTGTDIQMVGTSLIDGYNYNIDGSRGDPAGDKPGISIATPATTADLSAKITNAEVNKVLGTGGIPSLGSTEPEDIPALVATLMPLVDNTLTNTIYSDYDYGNAALGTSFVSYRNGNVRFAGNSRGAGVLIVTGKLEMDGASRFDGIVIVLGELVLTGSGPRIMGSVMMGPASSRVRMMGGATIAYSNEAVELAQHEARHGTYKSQGWQELSRN